MLTHDINTSRIAWKMRKDYVQHVYGEDGRSVCIDARLSYMKYTYMYTFSLSPVPYLSVVTKIQLYEQAAANIYKGILVTLCMHLDWPL